MLRSREVWNAALVPFEQPHEIDETAPYIVFNSKRLRYPGRAPIHTYADPFLFVRGSELFVFIEVQEVGRPGRIEAFVTTDLKRFRAVGCVLTPPFHVSYPQVIAVDGDIFMVPETSEANEVALYRFGRFPFELRRIERLLEGPYADPTLLRSRDRWWLFATTPQGLEIHYSVELNGPYLPHPSNPVETQAETARCGGSFLEHGNRLFRVAQDGSGEYGANLIILRVLELSETEYREEIVVRDLFNCEQDWNRRGGHHLSRAKFLGQELAAIDGKQADFPANRLLSIIWRMRF